jgi:hypothetical protein
MASVGGPDQLGRAGGGVLVRDEGPLGEEGRHRRSGRGRGVCRGHGDRWSGGRDRRDVLVDRLGGNNFHGWNHERPRTAVTRATATPVSIHLRMDPPIDEPQRCCSTFLVRKDSPGWAERGAR